MMKSWRTTTVGLLCWVCCLWHIHQGCAMHDFSFSDLDKTIHQSVLPFLAFAVGLGLIHARDHKHKDQ
jgi:hypothetical protein